MSILLEFEPMPRQRALVVRFQGEIDHHSAERLREQLEEEVYRPHLRTIVFNFRHLIFMDSAGIGLVLGRYKRLLANGQRLLFCEAAPNVYRLFEMSGLFKIIPVYRTEAEALSGLEVVSS